MITLNKSEWKVLAEILTLASEEFGRHICNDYDLFNTPENRELVERMERWNSEEDWQEVGLNISESGVRIHTQDYFLMDYFAHVAEENAKEDEDGGV